MNYSREDLTKTVDDYQNGATSSAVSAKYDVPESTVRNHKSNPRLGIGGGRPTLLTNHQQQYLIELLKNLEVIGARLTKSVVMKLATGYVQLVTGRLDIAHDFSDLILCKYDIIAQKGLYTATKLRSSINTTSQFINDTLPATIINVDTTKLN